MTNTVRTYMRCTIRRCKKSGYYEAYTGSRFVRADTLAGIKKFIKKDVKGV